MYPRQSKYKAIKCEDDNRKFDSKAERAYYQKLKLLQMAGEISFFLWQVPFHLPDGTKYICDFQVVYPDGKIEFIDVKGVETQVFKLKKRLVEFHYPVQIKVVKK